MSDEPSILIIDSDIAFAKMLQESLRQDAGYQATVATDREEALQALDATDFDLAIVDLGLTDTDGATIARALRQRQSNLRLMLIPLVGEEIPPELADLQVQGTLTKPFFLPELPERITDALARPISPVSHAAEAAGVEPDTHGGSLAALQGHLPKIVQDMTVLSQDIHAAAVILTCAESLIAYTGNISGEEAKGLAQAVAESWRTSARVAKILGREQLRFEQSVEGGEHMFYSLAVTDDVILSAALRTSVPLGMIRHRAKATAEALRALMGSVQ